MSHLRFCRATKSQRATMKSHAASKSRDKIAGVTWHFVAIKYPRIFNVHLHTDVEELRVQASDCSAICSHHKCKTSVRRVSVSVACTEYSLTQQRIQAYLRTKWHPNP